MSTIKLARPAAGEHAVVPSQPFAHIVLDFPADTAAMEHPEGSDSLIFHFADGSAIEMKDFYAQYGKGQMPEFEADGSVLHGEDFFASFGPGLAPAAPPRYDASSGHGLSDLPLDEGLDAGAASLAAQPQEGMAPAPDAAQAQAGSGAPARDGAGIFSMEEAYSEAPVLLLDHGRHEVSLEERHDDILLGHAPAEEHEEHEVHHDGEVHADKVSLTAEAVRNGASGMPAAPESGPDDAAAAAAAAAAAVQASAAADEGGLDAVLNAELEHAAMTVVLSS